MTGELIYLVRHGETEWNREQRMQGQWDSKLTPKGESQARANGRFLAQQEIGAMFASDLGRVRQTVGLIQESLPIDPIFDSRLQEWSSGDWSGHLYADLADKWPDEWAAWDADRYNIRPPGGENYHDLISRARSFLDEHKGDFAKETAIVAHGFMNRALAACLLDLAPAELMKIRQTNDTIIRVEKGTTSPGVVHFIGRMGPKPGLPQVRPRR